MYICTYLLHQEYNKEKKNAKIELMFACILDLMMRNVFNDFRLYISIDEYQKQQ